MPPVTPSPAAHPAVVRPRAYADAVVTGTEPGGRVGVVTLVHGSRELLALQHRSLVAQSRRPDHYAVVAMDDRGIMAAEVDGLRRDVLHLRSADGRLPLAAAINVGVDYLLVRGCEVLVSLDPRCVAGPDLVAAYSDALAADPWRLWTGPVVERCLVPGGTGVGDQSARADGGAAPGWPAPGERAHLEDAESITTWSFAVSARAWKRTGGFCEEYRGEGSAVTDFVRRAGLCGSGLGAVGSALTHRQVAPSPVTPVDHRDDVERNARIFHRRWGHWPPHGLAEAERVAWPRSADS